MDCLAAGRRRRGDDRRDVEVALRRRRRADAHRSIGEPHVQCIFVGGRVDGDGLDVELVQRADHAHGDLAAIRYEDSREHQTASSGRPVSGSRSKSTCPNSTGWRVLDVDPPDDRLDVGLHLVHELHRLEDAECLPGRDDVALLDEGRCTRLRRAVEGSDHRRLDPDETVRSRHRRFGNVFGKRKRRLRENLHRRVGRGAHGYAQPVLLDRDLADPRLLDDAHELADPLGARLVDGREVVLLAARAAADRRAAGARRPRRRARAAAAPPRSPPFPRPARAPR